MSCCLLLYCDDQGGIKWQDGKGSGVSLRSTRMKLPTSVGLKKSKAIENMCGVLGLETQVHPVKCSFNF